MTDGRDPWSIDHLEYQMDALTWKSLSGIDVSER